MVAYLTHEDLHRKLHDCVVMYDKRPCFVKVRIDDPLNVVSLTSIHMPTDALPGIKGTLVDVSKDEKFSTRLPLLGYINEGRNAYTVRRLPVRRNKVGLHAENLRIDNVNGVGGGINYANRSVADMLLNKYPKFSDALSWIHDRAYQSCAFCKTMYLSRIGNYEIGLFFLGRLIGMYSPSHEAIRLMSSLPDYSYVASIVRKHQVPTC